MAVFDVHGNLAVSAVATAPSPATSGTSLVVTTGQGTRFPAPPFNAVLCPAATLPDPSNAEIVRVTAIATDTLTIVRAQEGTSARTVVVTDQVFEAITAKTMTDVETQLNAQQQTAVNPAAVSTITIPGVYTNSFEVTLGMNLNTDWLFPFFCEDTVTFDQALGEVTTLSGGSTGRLALYSADSTWQLTGTLIEDFGTQSIASTGAKIWTPAATTRKLPPGRYMFAYNGSGTATFRAFSGTHPGGYVRKATMGSNAAVSSYTVARTNAAFPSTPTPWTAVLAATGFNHVFFLRVTAVGT